jgi:hypothetical protein
MLGRVKTGIDVTSQHCARLSRPAAETKPAWEFRLRSALATWQLRFRKYPGIDIPL